MAEDQKAELIKKLCESRENLNVLQNLFKREQWNVGQELRLASEAKQSISDALYALTGDEFYLNT
jgi:hypothetical protein